MLSVSETAYKLGVSKSRVRKMIADGIMPAEKIGNSWAIHECNVASRLDAKPKAGRPVSSRLENACKKPSIDLHSVYIQLKDGNYNRPSATEMSMIEDKDELGFLLTIYDYFLGLKQKEPIKKGVY